MNVQCSRVVVIAGIAALFTASGFITADEKARTGGTPSATPAKEPGKSNKKLDSQQFLKDHDKNNDGMLSRDELQGRVRGDFDLLDRNEDGKISREELEKHGARMLNRMNPEAITFVWIITAENHDPSLQELQRAYQTLRKLDKNQDGTIAQAEIKTARKELCEKRVDSVLNEFDEDNDGKLSRTEGESLLGKSFVQADRNKDSLISREELLECITKSPSGRAKDGGSESASTSS